MVRESIRKLHIKEKGVSSTTLRMEGFLESVVTGSGLPESQASLSWGNREPEGNQRVAHETGSFRPWPAPQKPVQAVS